ncbi:hypothetical protein HHI36_018157 [Cryptolaemus montrouzieri]|uniref:Ionotropic receptor n=1 Tax=Cryptolaemus montrouzieri TaxID=559131 RepID=A0ABD2NZ43_9CUCU
MEYGREMLSDWYPRKPDLYVLEEYNIDTIRMLANFSNLSFNPRAKFIFIGETFSVNFLSLISSFHILDALFVNSTTLELSTYFPYKSTPLNSSTHITLERIGLCGINSTMLENINYFPLKIPKYWKHFLLLVAYQAQAVFCICHDCERRGIWIETVEIILDHLRMEKRYYQTNKLSREEIFEKYNVHFSMSYATSPDYIEFTMTYVQDMSAWFVHIPLETPRWKYLIFVLSPLTWISCILIIVAMTTVWILSGFLFIGNYSCWDILKAVFDQFLEHSINLPRKSVHQTVLIVLIILLAFFMNTFFKSRFTYLLNGINYEDPIDSFEKIMKNQLIVGSYKSNRILLDTTPEIHEYLDKNFVECDGTPTCLRRVAQDRNFATFKSTMKTRSAGEFLIDKHTGQWLLKQISSSVFFRPIVANFQRGHPFFAIFNEYLFHLVESGIADKIIRKYNKIVEMSQPSSLDTHSLTFDNIVAPMALWTTGIFISLVMFVIENRYCVKYDE